MVDQRPDQTEDPIIVVGSGPSGIAVVRELLQRGERRRIALYGAEAVEPYDRVRLSSALAGECSWQTLTADAALPTDARIERHYGCAVVSIDRVRRHVVDAAGRCRRYSKLVLATGSRAHVPQIAGVDLPGVFTFRDLDDAQRLLARRVRTRRTVVLGGGLLGLEAARAMRRFNTGIVVIEHADRLMPRQLDEPAAQALRDEVERMGIRVIVADGVAELCGSGAVEAACLRSGSRIDCDTVIVATGIVPNVDLALQSGLPIGRGIKVDDTLRTQDPDIHAVGECAEHQGVVYGLVAPCLEQAAVTADRLTGGTARYRGSQAATRLKVLNVPVFSAGATLEQSPSGGTVTSLLYRSDDGRQLRSLLLRRGRLTGAQAVGDWPALPRVLEAVQHQRPIGWFDRRRFVRSGCLWPEAVGRSVAAWPAHAVVCNCTGVTRGALSAAIASGCGSRAQVAGCTRASTVCGSCAPLIDDLLGQGGGAAPVPVWGARWLLAMALAGLLATIGLGAFSGLPYVPSWSATEWRWDRLWRDGLIKQISGYGLLALAGLGLLLSLRKRWPRITLGHFALWRSLHVLLGLLAIAVLVGHTGGRLGYGLNAWLMGVFVAVIGAGAAAGALIAVEHRLAPVQARWARRRLTWLHILTFWPLPALLGIHVLKTYYF